MKNIMLTNHYSGQAAECDVSGYQMSRDFLKKSTIITGTLLVLALVWIFTGYLKPSAAINKPWDEIDLSMLSESEVKKYNIKGKPVIVVFADNEIVSDLESLNTKVWDQNIYSKLVLSDGSTYFIFYSISTQFGCGLKHFPKGSVDTMVANREWYGGFIDMCHSAVYDYAGRALRVGINVPNALTPKVHIQEGSIAKVVTWPLTQHSTQTLKYLPPNVVRYFSAG